MPKAREPIDLIRAKGKKHLSKSEYEERKAQELKVPFIDVEAPDYLDAKQKKKFDDIANKLLALEIMTELDVDCLARYIISHDLYLSYTKVLTSLIKENDVMLLKEAQNLQDKAFRQAQSAARDLGLTITSRTKIVIPSPPDDDEEL